MKNFCLGLAAALTAGLASMSAPVHAGTLSYKIIDLGAVSSTDWSEANAISANGKFIAGRSLGDTGQATLWSNNKITALPNLNNRQFASAYSINDQGVAVGFSTASALGEDPRPIMWSNGTGKALALQAGESIGRAFGINNDGTIVGSVGGGGKGRATIWKNGVASYIDAKLADGTYMEKAFGINDAGLVVGVGINASDPLTTVGLVYDSVKGIMTSVGFLPGGNSALAFGLSNSGFVVGSGISQQGDERAFLWSATGGMVDIPLGKGMDLATAYAVNDAGWVVGSGGGDYSVPFLYRDGKTYRLQDLIGRNSGWDLSTNTYGFAAGISKDGTIVGSGLYNGNVHAFRMVLNTISAVPEPSTWAMMIVGVMMVGGAMRRRASRMARTALV